jgi:uncharacterized protein involved in exopolysaccharide biosynthesis
MVDQPLPSATPMYAVLNGGDPFDRPRATFTFSGLRWMLPVIAQHWRFILRCTLLGLIASIVALPLMETQYLVSAKVLVQIGREMTLPPTAMAKDSVPQSLTSKRPEDLGSEIEIMKDPQLIEELVRSFGPDYFLAEPPAVTLWQEAKRLVRRSIRFMRETVSEGLIMLGVRRPVSPAERVAMALRQALVMEDVRKSDVISVYFRSSSPEMGVAVLQKYLELFQEKHISAYRSPRNREFFEAEADRSLQQLREAQTKLARFKEENKVWSITEQNSLLLKTQRELIDTHAKTLREKAEVQNRMIELRRQEALLPPETRISRLNAHDPVSDEMRKTLAKLEADIAHAAAKWGENSPEMKQLRSQLGTMKAGIAARESTRGDQETMGLNQQLVDVRREIAGNQTQLTGLEARAENETAQIEVIEKSIRQLSATETKLYDMQREISRLDREYQLYTARLEESRISESMDLAKISNVRVISPPTADPIPVFPPVIMVLAGGIILGLGGSLAFVLLRDAFRPVVRTHRDVEILLGAPVLASLPHQRALR